MESKQFELIGIVYRKKESIKLCAIYPLSAKQKAVYNPLNVN